MLRRDSIRSQMKNLAAPRFLYRCFDAKGLLLYVGLSSDIVRRLQVHGSASPWSGKVQRVEAERVGSRKQALKAERDAINSEQPAHNTLKTNGKEWDEIVRLRKSGLTLAAIGKQFGISRQRVHQIITEYKGVL